MSNTVLNLTNITRRVDYLVKLPEWANITLKTTNGEIQLSGARFTGTFTASSTNGKISAEGLENSTRLETTNGEITLNVTKLGADGVSCETTNGRISVAVPAEIKASVSLRVTNGTISTPGLELNVAEQSRHRVDGALNGGGPMVRLQTTNGTVQLRRR